MKRITVLLADTTRARIFTVEEKRGQGGNTEPALEEHVDLVQAGRRLRPAEALSDSRPGSQRSVGTGHAVDDHRDAKASESDRKFAVEVMTELEAFCTKNEAEELLVCAPPRFMGHLREHGQARVKEANYVALDISSLSAPQALEHLTKHGHLKV